VFALLFITFIHNNEKLTGIATCLDIIDVFCLFDKYLVDTKIYDLVRL